MSNLTKNDVPVICGVEISTDVEGRFNINMLHRASGAGDDKSPGQWLRRKTTKELIEELDSNLLKNNQNVNIHSAQKSINVVNGGTAPGTFAHELLAIEYAGWISASFRLQVNQTFLDYRRGKLTPVIDVPPQPQPQVPSVHIDKGIIELARVVAEATMKVCLDATGYSQPATPAYFSHAEGEYVPVSKAAWETGLSDSTCRKLIGFFKVPVRSNGGPRGLLVNLPEMKKAADRLLRESAAPTGKRKRWTHPQFGSFTCYTDLI